MPVKELGWSLAPGREACPSQKTGRKWVGRGLVDLSTIFFFHRTNVVYTTSRKAV
jgi:hypothetical protein